MTRKHFQALANMVQNLHNEATQRNENGHLIYSDDLAHALADFCAEQNSNFKRDLFLKACGVNND